MAADVDDFLAHYGVLGMKWGVRNDDVTPGKTSSKKQSNLKKAAAITGGVVLVAGATYLAYKMKKPSIANVAVSKLTTPTAPSKVVLDRLMNSPKANFKVPPKTAPSPTLDQMTKFLNDQKRNGDAIRKQTSSLKNQDLDMLGDINEMLKRNRL